MLLWNESKNDRIDRLNNLWFMKILVTGAAGFIGSKLMGVLASRGDEYVGFIIPDNYFN